MGETLFAIQPERYFPQFLAKHTRPDGRGLGEARVPQGRTNVITSCHGSASVSLGHTMAVCAARGEIGSDAKQGVIVAVTVAPSCGMHVRDGDALSYDLTPRIQKLIDEPKVLDRRKLVIEEDTAFWVVKVDIVLLSIDGNAMDAAMLSALLALRTTTLPPLERGENSRYDVSTAAKPEIPARRLEFGRLPVAVSCGTFQSTWIVDPTLLEENILESQITVTCIDGDYNWDQQGRTGVVSADRRPLEMISNVASQWTAWLESFS